MYGKVATVSPSPVSDDIILLGTNQEQVIKKVGHKRKT